MSAPKQTLFLGEKLEKKLEELRRKKRYARPQTKAAFT